MRVPDKNFGVVISLLLPGFICLWGLSFSVPQIGAWLLATRTDATPTVGGFFYSTLASLSLGLVLSALRWMIVDHLHLLTGVKASAANFASLSDDKKLAAFEAVVENHYRYYQYYANTLVAILCSAVAVSLFSDESLGAKTWVGVLGISLALFLGSRDALRKYNQRSEAVLGTA
jgi:hypothetical protein